MATDNVVDTTHLSEHDAKDVVNALALANQQNAMNQFVNGLTDMCWKKCIPARIATGPLEAREQSCVVNCVKSWAEARQRIVGHLKTEASKAGNPVI